MDQSQAIAIITNYLEFLQSQQLKISRAYLFGSYARGGAHEDSDIDLAVVFDELADRYDMQVHLMKLGLKIDTRIEPHPFAKADFDDTRPFVHEILRTGVRII